MLYCAEGCDHSSEELCKFSGSHLACGHGKLLMLNRALPADVSIDLYVIRRVGKHSPRPIGPTQWPSTSFLSALPQRGRGGR